MWMAPYILFKFCLEMDTSNVNNFFNNFAGKWIVRLRKGLASRCWENLIMAMLGEQFMVGEEVCGAVVSIRYQVRKDGIPFKRPREKKLLQYYKLGRSRIRCQNLDFSRKIRQIDIEFLFS